MEIDPEFWTMRIKLTQLVFMAIAGLVAHSTKAQKAGTCDPVKLKHIFTQAEQSSKFFSVVIGINNTKKEAPTPLEDLLSSEDVSAVATVTIKDQKEKESTKMLKSQKGKTGLWTFEGEFASDYSGQMNRISGVSIRFITKCKDTQVFDAKYRNLRRKRAKHLRTWERILVAEKEDVVLEGKKFYGMRGIEIGGSTITVSGGNIQMNGGSEFNLKFNTSPPSNGNLNIGISMELVDEKGNSETHTEAAKWNKETQTYEVKNTFGKCKTCVFVIERIKGKIISDTKDTSFVETKDVVGTTMDKKSLVVLVKRTGKGKYVDPCKTKYKLKKVSYTETTVSGIYALNFFFNFTKKSDVPSKVVMKIQLKDCKGESLNLAIKIKYDEKSGMYVGSQSMPQQKGCDWTLFYGEVGAYNPCEDLSAWSFDPSKAKGFGKGTKNAASQTSAKPRLL